MNSRNHRWDMSSRRMTFLQRKWFSAVMSFNWNELGANDTLPFVILANGSTNYRLIYRLPMFHQHDAYALVVLTSAPRLDDPRCNVRSLTFIAHYADRLLFYLFDCHLVVWSSDIDRRTARPINRVLSAAYSILCASVRQWLNMR